MSFNEKIEAYGSEAQSLKTYYWFLYLCAAASAYMMFYCSSSMQIPSIIAQQKNRKPCERSVYVKEKI